MEIYFVTSNKIKLDIANEVLGKYGIHAEQYKFDFKELQSFDLKEVAVDKASQVIDRIDKKFIVDDSGMYIDALNGFPGALLKPVNKVMGAERMLMLLGKKDNRSATFANILAFGDPETKEIKTFSTDCRGRLSETPEGSRPVGWAIERIFIPDGFDKTIAQLDDKEWNVFWEGFKDIMHYNKFGKWATDEFGKT